MRNGGFAPKGRRALPKELLQFGVHLVYSEGSKTEPYYVNNIKKNIARKYNCAPNQIDIVTASDKKSYNTVGLVEYAKADVDKRLQRGERIDHVWIFFDKDDFVGFEEAHAAILAQNDSKSTNADGFTYNKKTHVSWHSCYSNECFELWLCLYFDFYNVPHHRKDYKQHLQSRPALKKIGFVYEKNLADLHDVFTAVGGSLSDAIARAKMLQERNGIANPSTGVYGFAEYFYRYMTARN